MLSVRLPYRDISGAPAQEKQQADIRELGGGLAESDGSDGGCVFYDRLCRRMVLALAGGMYIVHLFRFFDLERDGDIISL